MFQFIHIFLIVLVSNIIVVSSRDRPPLYQFDDYQRCKVRGGSYCFTKTVLNTPDTGSAEMQQMMIRVNFRPDLLEWGVCTKECEDEVNGLTKMDRIVLMHTKFPVDFTYKYPRKYFPELEYMETLFGDLVHICINSRLHDLYNVTGYPDLEFCTTSNYVPWKVFDWFECFFYIVMFSSFVGFSMCNVLDLCGPRLFRSFLIIQSVSVRRNWRLLTTCSAEDCLPEIRCIEGLRLLLTVIVIAFHCFLLMIAFPVEDPESIEYYLSSPIVINILCCLFWVVPVFLTMDGFLMMSHFMDFREKRPAFDGRYFRQVFVFRLIEIIPLYSLAMLYSSVMDGIWGAEPTIGRYLMLTREERLCRRNFWANVLFVNNYPVTDEMCFVHGWYFAAALQLFLAAALVLWIMWKYPNMIQLFKWTIPAIAILLPGISVLLYEAEPLPPLRINDISSLFMYQSWFRYMYLPGHMNAGCYAVGMVAGYYAHMVKIAEISLNRNKIYKWTKRLAFPLTVVVGTVPFMFYTHNIAKPSFLSACYAILFRNSCIVFCAVSLFERFHNIPVCIRRFLCTKLFVIPARLCYGLYVIHFVVLRSFLALEDVNEKFSIAKFPLLFGKVFVISFLLAVVTYLWVEQPTRQYFGITLYPKPPRGRKSRGMRFVPLEMAARF